MKVNMTNKPRYSIIISTISDEPLTIKSFPSNEELARLGIELIVSKDRGWRNPSRTRNVGASVSRGEILCFLDDDASLNFEKLLHVLNLVRENKKGFV
jgi:glycosyltransferase involved in cell wall biosynthesis